MPGAQSTRTGGWGARLRRAAGICAIVAGFVVPAGVLGAWLYWQVTGRGMVPAYVIRFDLPTAQRAPDLPLIEGPADASRPLVVIDAGHGGHDPGASGPGGEQEKVLTLALAQVLRDALIAKGRVRVALTRHDDRYLTLPDRASIARRLHADLFVSVHADAAENPAAIGASVYTLSDRGSSALADAVAARENHVDQVNGVALGGQDDTVSQVLIDLSQARMRARSQALAGLIRREGQGHFRFREDPLQQAAFVVLKSLDLPSVLVEAGYISNREDVRLMQSPQWRADFAQTLARAITIFLATQSETPP